jgi:hypothetical protein
MGTWNRAIKYASHPLLQVLTALWNMAIKLLLFLSIKESKLIAATSFGAFDLGKLETTLC